MITNPSPLRHYKPRRNFSTRSIAHKFLRSQKPEPIRTSDTAEIYWAYVELGKRVRVGHFCVLGHLGFGFECLDSKLIRINHVGKVIIEDDVELGAGCIIDRAKLEATIIGRGTKFDSRVFVAHNTVIGQNCEIAAGTVFGGSVNVGDNCFIGLNATIKDHVNIGKNCVIGSGANVISDIPDDSVAFGNPAKVMRQVNPERDPLPLRRMI